MAKKFAQETIPETIGEGEEMHTKSSSFYLARKSRALGR